MNVCVCVLPTGGEEGRQEFRRGKAAPKLEVGAARCGVQVVYSVLRMYPRVPHS